MEFSEEKLLPRRPYLFRAFYDWIIDNELTPLVVVNASVSGVNVPQEYIKDGKIILNIAPQSVGQFVINNNEIEFNARFNGVLQHVFAPMAAIEAIYARENGAGLGFAPEPQYEVSTQVESEPDHSPEVKTKPTFRVVK